jgi:hypothetical protein
VTSDPILGNAHAVTHARPAIPPAVFARYSINVPGRPPFNAATTAGNTRPIATAGGPTSNGGNTHPNTQLPAHPRNQSPDAVDATNSIDNTATAPSAHATCRHPFAAVGGRHAAHADPAANPTKNTPTTRANVPGPAPNTSTSRRVHSN